MRWRVVVGNLGTMLRLFSLTLLVPLALGFVFEPRTVVSLFGVRLAETSYAFALTFIGAFFAGLLLETVGTSADFRDKEAYVLVGVGWIVCTVVAAVPYLLTGTVSRPADAFFEAMSGLTTTGASVLTPPLEAIPASVHIWRGLTQWVGGLGIVVLTVALLSRLASAGARLLQAELPGGKVDRLRPSIIQTARGLWVVYGSLSLALVVLLFALMYREIGDVRTAALDAMVHTFTTLSTGGFSTRSASIEAYDSPLIEITMIVFLVLAGTNFAILYRAARGRPGALFRDDEVRFYFAILVVAIAAIALVLLAAPSDAAFWTAHGGRDILTAVRMAAFQVVSLMTTAGFSSADFGAWPELARFLLIFLMFVGGCTGSTGGSIKIARVLLLFRLLTNEIRRIVHPHAVLPVRLRHEVVDNPTLQRVMVFVFAYLTAFIAGTAALLALETVSVIDAASGVAATLGNVGPGVGVFGPAANYAGVSDAGTVLLSVLMWLGRLELFAVLVLFSPETYR